METLGILSKDQTFDPGVNLDSCEEDSDCEALNNNEKAHCPVGGNSVGPNIVLNDLSSESCQCTGIKCLCDDTVDTLSPGGPNADPGQKECKGNPAARSSKCTGANTKKTYSTGVNTFECGKAHDGLCKSCATKCRFCPICGRQYARNPER